MVVRELLDMDTLTRRQAYPSSGRNLICPSVRMHGHIRIVVDFLIWKRIVYPDQDISTAPVDDIFCFEPVEMVGRLLSFFHKQQFFRIHLRIFLGH